MSNSIVSTFVRNNLWEPPLSCHIINTCYFGSYAEVRQALWHEADYTEQEHQDHIVTSDLADNNSTTQNFPSSSCVWPTQQLNRQSPTIASNRGEKP